MFDVTPPKRTVVFIGKGPDLSAADIGEVVTLPCEIERAGEVLEALRARLRGFGLGPLDLEGITPTDIDALADRCRKAKYGVVVWAPPSLNFPHAELTVDQVSGLVKDLNQSTRFAGLALGGAEGAVTAGAVCAWQSGYPLRVSYASGAPDYDPYRYSIRRMLAEGEGDLLVWIASISPDVTPPATDLPTIVLGTPGLKLSAASHRVYPRRHSGCRPRRTHDTCRQRRVLAADGSRSLGAPSRARYPRVDPSSPLRRSLPSPC